MKPEEKEVLEEKIEMHESEVSLEQEEEGNVLYAIFPRNIATS